MIKIIISARMQGFSVRYLLSYSQRALTPGQYSSLLQQSTKQMPFNEMMHSLHLYENNVQVFDYDLYHKLCFRVLDYQKKINVADICTILKLGVRHQIRSQVAWKHLEAELYRRLYNAMNPLFESEKLEAEELSKSTMRMLEQNSQDYFQLLTPQFIQSQSQPNAGMDQRREVKKQKGEGSIKAISEKKRPEILSRVDELVEPLIWYGCSNMKFLTLLLETQLHPTVLKSSPASVIKFAELLTYICQMHFKQYESNKGKYTGRSVKKIYQFQSQYFLELIRNTQKCIGQFETSQLRYLAEVVGSFPVKKRELRIKMVDTVATELRRRSSEIQQQEKQKLEQILGKDQKLIAKFRKSIGLIHEELKKQPQKQGSNKSQQEKEREEGQAKPGTL